jgi:hypothetical protein
VYRDGNLDGSGDVGNIPLNTLDIWIGSGHPSSFDPIQHYYFNGVIDDFRNYGRAFPATEVQYPQYFDVPRWDQLFSGCRRLLSITTWRVGLGKTTGSIRLSDLVVPTSKGALPLYVFYAQKDPSFPYRRAVLDLLN